VLLSSDASMARAFAYLTAAVAPVVRQASDSVFNFGHIKLPILSAADTSVRFSSMFHPLNTVLFYTWLGYSAAMPRKLVWIEKQNFQGFGCSECNWMFQPLGALVAESMDEMKQKYGAQRDNEFAAHVCVKHPRATKPKTE
jgi:hypothetical protein